MFKNKKIPYGNSQVGGHRSYFLLGKDGRKPLKTDTLRALLPTDAEAPKLKEEKEEDKGFNYWFKILWETN